MSFDKVFDFRASSGYVTDPANGTWVVPADTYPTTRNGVTFGWEDTTGLDARDRDTGVDARISGISFHSNIDNNTDIFRVDLPAPGTYQIGLAIGDAAGANAQNTYIVVSDNSVVGLIEFGPIATDSSHYADAAGNLWTTGAWPGSNVLVPAAFATTVLRVFLGGTIDAAASCISHLSIFQASVGGGTQKIIMLCG